MNSELQDSLRTDGTRRGPRQITRELCAKSNKFDRSVSLVCWVYNEEELIGEYLERAYQMMSDNVLDFEIIVVDDGSRDRTNEIIKQAAARMPAIKLITNEVNLNIGRASHRGIMAATKEFLFWQTIDWSYDLSNLRIFLELLKTYDVVAGVRRQPVQVSGPMAKPMALLFQLLGRKHITRRSDTVSKAVVSILNYLLIRSLFRLALSDYQNVVFYPSKLIQGLGYDARSSFGNPEVLLKAHWSGKSIVEVPISFIPRQAGEAKGTRIKAIRASLSDIFRFWYRWRFQGQWRTSVRGSIIRLDPQEWDDATKQPDNA